jgi:hypothetical protein
MNLYALHVKKNDYDSLFLKEKEAKRTSLLI